MGIALEQLADNSVADRNFQKLQAFVPDTGGLSIGIRAGVVSSTGTILRGTGFTAARTSGGGAAGDYTVTLAFTAAPAVLVAAEGAGAITAKLISVSTSSFRVLTFNTATGANADSAFGWVAVG